MSGGHYGCSGAVKRPSQRSGWGQEAPPGSPGRTGRHLQKSGIGRDFLAEVREGSGELPEGPVDSPLGSGGVGSPSRRSGIGREAHAEVREGIERPLQRSGRGREALGEVR